MVTFFWLVMMIVVWIGTPDQSSPDYLRCYIAFWGCLIIANVHLAARKD